MRFCLHYRGPLKANGLPAHKHELRTAFHSQLSTLWKQKPLDSFTQYLSLSPPRGSPTLLRPLGAFQFAPLATAEQHTLVDLKITLLRPEAPGNLITKGGDIDNRLKTLFDALTMPRLLNALPAGAVPTSDQQPFYCLLEDDNLVASVSARTEQLLESNVSSNEADVLIDVTTRILAPTFGNLHFA